MPSFVGMMRDRRVASTGQILADTYREGRAEALRRGIAVLVRWRSDGAGKGTIEMRQVVVPIAGTGVIKTCTTADFGSASTETRQVSFFSFVGTRYELASMAMLNEAGAAISFADVCFSPEGRAYRRYSESDPMTPLAGVPRYEITNTNTGSKRTVFVPPNGVARYKL